MDGLTFAFLLIGAVLLLGWGVLYLQEHRSRKRCQASFLRESRRTMDGPPMATDSSHAPLLPKL
jgi:hypothetical protein